MQLHLLRLFVDIADAGSISRVALERGQAQSHVSRQLTQLERECGGLLFDRTGRGVVLSDLGKRILPKILAWLNATDGLVADIKSSSGVISGSVHIGIMPSAAQLITELFRQLQTHYPNIRLRVSEGGALLENWVETGEVDIGILFRYRQQLQKTEQALSTADIYLVGAAGDRLTRAKQIEFARLADLPLVLPARHSDLREMVERIAREQNITLNVVAEANSVNFQKMVVLDGLGYSLMGTSNINRELAGGRLQVTRVIKPHIKRTMTLAVSPQGSLSTACRTVIQLLSQIAKHRPQELTWPVD